MAGRSPVRGRQSLFMASSLDEAVSALADGGGGAAAFAGGTWIMRAPIRGEAPAAFHVGLGRIRELTTIETGPDEISIGACVTHARLVAALTGQRQFAGLVGAARGAANPAVRELATVGGNLCAAQFPASDLIPALMGLDAKIELANPAGAERVSVERFLEMRRTLVPGTVLTRIFIPRSGARSAHARLPMRKAGDYPVAIVSMAADLDADGSAHDIRIGVGSVEAAARRWPELEAGLTGRRLIPSEAKKLAEGSLAAFNGRDGIEAPGWYRLQVLPVLVRRAAEALLSS